MTLSTIVQAAAKRLQVRITEPTFTVSTAVENNYILLAALATQATQDISTCYAWPELQKEYTFTLATNTDSYAFPADLDRIQFETLWNRTQHWPLIGPLNAYEWQVYKSGQIANFPMQRFRVKGFGLTQFYVDPTPDSSVNGQTMAFEYITRHTCYPLTWTASTTWTGYQYCTYNGYIFDRGGTGAATTGTSAPTPSSLNDGSITWALFTGVYDSFTYVNDSPIVDERLIEDRIVWNFKRERGLDYEDLKREAEEDLEIRKTRLSSAGLISINGRRYNGPWIGTDSYPIGNYGI